MHDGKGSVARILYKEIVPGDIRKVLAKSNDAKTGGGARDFRFGSYKLLKAVVEQMFPNKVSERRKRDEGTDTIDVYQGLFYWHEEKEGKTVLHSKISTFEPPTIARPSEGRITCVHEYGCFDIDRMPKWANNNRILLLLIQLCDGTVWPRFAEEKTLRIPGRWDAAVAREILACLDAKRAPSIATIGYKDFTDGGRYCNGK